MLVDSRLSPWQKKGMSFVICCVQALALVLLEGSQVMVILCVRAYRKKAGCGQAVDFVLLRGNVDFAA